MSSIGERLKEERERLGKTLPQFAEAAGAKKNTLIDWQKDVSSPPAVKLAALAKIGVDILYVITGQQTDPKATLDRQERLARDIASGAADDRQARETMLDAASGSGAIEAIESLLSKRQAALLMDYECLSDEDKLIVERTANALAKATSSELNSKRQKTSN